MIRVLAITGPTATGKTGAAVRLAHTIRSEIVSVDSRQVYRGLDLGTGKDLDEYAAVTPPVPYHLIDIVEPTELYTVFHYQRDCYAVLAELAKRPPFVSGTAPVLLVGGTGLYLEAVLRQFRLYDVAENPALRARLMQLGRSELERRLRNADPRIAEETDMSSRKRIVRGLEVAHAKARSAVATSDPCPVELEHRVVELTLPRDQLNRRIHTRLAERLEHGMVDEVRSLLDRGVPAQRLIQLGLEYREITHYLCGTTGFDTMVERLETAIHRFAKRQATYLRGLPSRGIPVHRLHAQASEELLDHAISPWLTA
jgi:tRNA dimethylallyltransferase